MAKFERKQVDVLTPEQAALKMREGFDLRSEYMILRKRAEQRLRDLKSAGFGSSQIYRENKNLFPTAKEIGTGQKMNKGLLYDAYAEVTRFLAAKRSTAGGIRAELSQAAETFRGHYGDELPDMPQELFGELMRAIKGHAQGKAYYRGWQKAYRQVLSNADRAGLSPDNLLDAVKNGEIQIGPKGGLWDVAEGRRISGKWAGMGN